MDMLHLSFRSWIAGGLLAVVAVGAGPASRSHADAAPCGSASVPWLADVTGDGIIDRVALVCRDGRPTDLVMVAGRDGMTADDGDDRAERAIGADDIAALPAAGADDYRRAAWALRLDAGWFPMDDSAARAVILADVVGDGVADIVVRGTRAVYVWRGGADLPRHAAISRAAVIFADAVLVDCDAGREGTGEGDPGPDGDDAAACSGIADVNADGHLDLVVEARADAALYDAAGIEGSVDADDVGVPAFSDYHVFLSGRAWPRVVDLSTERGDVVWRGRGAIEALGDLDGDGWADARWRVDGLGGAARTTESGPLSRLTLADVAPLAAPAFVLPEGVRMFCTLDATAGGDSDIGKDKAIGQDSAIAGSDSDPMVYLPMTLNLANPAPYVPPLLTPASSTPRATATTTTVEPPVTPPGPTDAPSATAEPSATPTPPKATPDGSDQAIAFPVLDKVMLGTCSPDVHDRYAVMWKDGLRYRTWHPVTVPLDPANPGAGTCTFAHSHGDAAVQGTFTESPPFGYNARLFGDAGMIRAHPGYKVIYHAAEGSGKGSEAEWRITFHQGTAGVARLTADFHDIQIELHESDGHRTEVRIQGDTGALNPKSGPRVGDRFVPDVQSASKADPDLYEVWYVLTQVGDGDALGGAAFIARPGFATLNAMTYMDPADLTKVFPTSLLLEQLPRGDPKSAYLGNMHLIEHPDLRWDNADGPEVFWTTIEGESIDEAAAEACTHSTCVEQRVARQSYVDPDDVRNRNFDRPMFELPIGAAGGN